MELLRHIVEPSRLLMTWQPADENVYPRTRRVVAEIIPGATTDAEWTFNYFLDSPDFLEAKEAGFKGYPAFRIEGREFSLGVRDTLLRRLPPRSRDDFPEYLAMHRLPYPLPVSDLALLGYTGARLPSDGFCLVPVFPLNQEPNEYILEISGVRHCYQGDIADIRVGDSVTFSPEPTNETDANAISINWTGLKLGYVNRALLDTFHHWLSTGSVHGRIERKNGKIGRAMIYVRVFVNCEETIEAA